MTSVCLGLLLVFCFGHQQLPVGPTNPSTTQATICGCELPALKDTVHFLTFVSSPPQSSMILIH